MNKTAAFTTWVLCGILLTWLAPAAVMVVVGVAVLGAVGVAAHLDEDG